MAEFIISYIISDDNNIWEKKGRLKLRNKQSKKKKKHLEKKKNQQDKTK